MLPSRLKIILVIAIVVFFVIIFYMLKHKRLTLKYTLLWLFTGFAMLILVLFPELMLGISQLIGVQTVMNTLYIFLFAFILMLLMMLTSIVSKQTERIKMLAQNNALLEEKMRELEGRVKNEKNNKQDYSEE